MRKILVIALSLTTLVGLAACSNAANMATDFPCDYSAQVDEFTTGETLPYLSDVIDATYPYWYIDDWSASSDQGEFKAEWGRLILARNGFSSDNQIEPGSTIKIPARCADLGDDATPQSSD